MNPSKTARLRAAELRRLAAKSQDAERARKMLHLADQIDKEPSGDEDLPGKEAKRSPNG